MAYLPNTWSRLPTDPLSLMLSFPARFPLPLVAIWPTAVIGLPLTVPLIANPYLPVRLAFEQAVGCMGCAQREVPSTTTPDGIKTTTRTSLEIICFSFLPPPDMCLQFSSGTAVCQDESVCSLLSFIAQEVGSPLHRI